MSQTWFKNLEYRSNATYDEKVQIKLNILYIKAKVRKITLFFVGEAESEPTIVGKKNVYE